MTQTTQDKYEAESNAAFLVIMEQQPVLECLKQYDSWEEIAADLQSKETALSAAQTELAALKGQLETLCRAETKDRSAIQGKQRVQSELEKKINDELEPSVAVLKQCLALQNAPASGESAEAAEPIELSEAVETLEQALNEKRKQAFTCLVRAKLNEFCEDNFSIPWDEIERWVPVCWPLVQEWLTTSKATVDEGTDELRDLLEFIFKLLVKFAKPVGKFAVEVTEPWSNFRLAMAQRRANLLVAKYKAFKAAGMDHQQIMEMMKFRSLSFNFTIKPEEIGKRLDDIEKGISQLKKIIEEASGMFRRSSR